MWNSKLTVSTWRKVRQIGSPQYQLAILTSISTKESFGMPSISDTTGHSQIFLPNALVVNLLMSIMLWSATKGIW
jgi:hypothetical protein